ncbi:hypothetical protein LP417_35180 (plasmid) [Polaromonas sp. P1-6]|nr:hypothetical protein LP417_35180 [Polaromonas sp. P1-6]
MPTPSVYEVGRLTSKTIQYVIVAVVALAVFSDLPELVSGDEFPPLLQDMQKGLAEILAPVKAELKP